MADTKAVRQNNKFALDWKIKNYVPGAQVGLKVTPDPGDGKGTEPVPLAPDAITTVDADGNGKSTWQTAIPNLGTFTYTLTAKQPKRADVVQTTKVTVKKLHYKSFAPAGPRVSVGEKIKLSWEIEVADGCTFKLLTTTPDGKPAAKVDVTVDGAGKGSVEVQPAVAGEHKYQLECTDPFLPAGQSPEACPVVSVFAVEKAFKVEYDDFKKGSLKITFQDGAVKGPPAYAVQGNGSDRTAGAKRGVFTDKGAVWEAVVAVVDDTNAVDVQVFKAKGETKAIQQQAIWFKPTKAGEAPTIMTGAPPGPAFDAGKDSFGALGSPYLDAGKLGGLSAKRQKLIRDFLPKAVPSKVGSKEFDLIITKAANDAILDGKPNPKFDPDQPESKDNPKMKPAPSPHFTTCGELIGFLVRQFKDSGNPTMGGLIGNFWAAKEPGNLVGSDPAWVTADGTNVPQPGDVFLITIESTTPEQVAKTKGKNEPLKKGETNAFDCQHTGVFVDVDTGQCSIAGHPVWVVAEAGQGGPRDQYCHYGKNAVRADAKGAPLLIKRRLAGWVNIDNYKGWV